LYHCILNFINYFVRYEVFTAVKIQVEVVWVVTPCGVAAGYHYFGRPCYIPEYGGSKVL
jgi:hypothetical protein